MDQTFNLGICWSIDWLFA